MKTCTLLLSSLFLFGISLSAQVPFQGEVTTRILPIRSAQLQRNIQVLYHSSFDGNLKVYINDEVVFDKEVQQGVQGTLNLGGSIPNSQRAIMKIVLDDLFYLEEVINFHHPYLRINYQKEDRQLALYFEDNLPTVEEMQADQLKEQVTLAIQERLGGGGR